MAGDRLFSFRDSLSSVKEDVASMKWLIPLLIIGAIAEDIPFVNGVCLFEFSIIIQTTCFVTAPPFPRQAKEVGSSACHSLAERARNQSL